MNRHRVVSGLCTLLLVAAAGCSSTTSSRLSASTSTPTGDTSASSTAPTSSSSSSTTIPTVDPLLLRLDGVGTHDFGNDVGAVVDDFTTLLGAPASDVAAEYPTLADGGRYESTDDEYRFIAPFSRTVCWSNSLCLAFGGVNSTALFFTGWRYDSDPTGSLTSTSGATLGTRWTDIPSMTIAEGGCFTVGYGEVDGIDVVVQSDGLQFVEVDDSGNYIMNTPSPADVTILSMEAGDLPVSSYADC